MTSTRLLRHSGISLLLLFCTGPYMAGDNAAGVQTGPVETEPVQTGPSQPQPVADVPPVEPTIEALSSQLMKIEREVTELRDQLKAVKEELRLATVAEGESPPDQPARTRIAELERSLKLIQWLAVGAALLGLGGILVAMLRRRHSAPEVEGADEPPRNILHPRPVGDSSEGTPKTVSTEPPSPGSAPGPIASPEPKPQDVPRKPEPTTPPAPITGDPIVVALTELQRAVPALAEQISEPRQRARFIMQLDEPLLARLDRYHKRKAEGEAALREHWVEQDLVTALNILAQALSQAIEDRRSGQHGSQELAKQLQHWLYDRLAPACEQQGWFRVEQILPYTTRFDPSVHYSVGSRDVEAGAADLIVAMRTIGRRDPQGRKVTHQAEVVVGR